MAPGFESLVGGKRYARHPPHVRFDPLMPDIDEFGQRGSSIDTTGTNDNRRNPARNMYGEPDPDHAVPMPMPIPTSMQVPIQVPIQVPVVSVVPTTDIDTDVDGKEEENDQI